MYLRQTLIGSARLYFRLDTMKEKAGCVFEQAGWRETNDLCQCNSVGAGTWKASGIFVKKAKEILLGNN